MALITAALSFSSSLSSSEMLFSDDLATIFGFF